MPFRHLGIEYLVALEGNDRSRAAAIIKTTFDLEGDYPDETMLRLAEILWMEDTETALSELKEISKSSDISSLTRSFLSHAASKLGNAELAFESLRESIVYSPDTLTAIWHPTHRAIRQLPDFKDYVRKKGLYDYWRTSGKWGDFCRPEGDDDFVCN